MSPSGGSVALDKISMQFQGGFVSIVFCAVLKPPDFVLRLVCCAAVSEELGSDILRELRVIDV